MRHVTASDLKRIALADVARNQKEKVERERGRMKKVTQVEKIEGEYVKFDDGACYERYSADEWLWKAGGGSVWEESNPKNLEAAYVNYKLRKLNE